MFTMKHVAVSAIALASVLAFADTAAAQDNQSVTGTGLPATEAADASGEGLADIVVTAQKRKQRLQDVGIAVTALSGDALVQSGVSSSSDLATKVVGMENFSPFGPGTSANVVIRGIGLNDFGDGHEAPVTTYIDEFYIVSVPAADFGLYDIANVEVLRGPQGTLFGRNSTGGLVNYTTTRPTNEFTGQVIANYGSFNELRIEGGVTVPLGGGFSSRVSFLSHHSDGYVSNLNPEKPRSGRAGTNALRGQLRYEGGGWDINLKADYGKKDTIQPYIEHIPSITDPVTGLVYANRSGVDAAGYSERGTRAAPANIAFSNTPTDYLRSEFGNFLLRIEKQFGDTTFSSLTGYMFYNRQLLEDSDGSPNNINIAVFPYDGDEFTQELRLFLNGGNVKLTAGVFGLVANGHSTPEAKFNIPVSSPAPLDAHGLYTGAYYPINLFADYRIRTKSVSAFAQVEAAVSPTLNLIAGGRITYDDKKIADRDNAAYRDCPGGDGVPGADGVNRLCYLVADGGSGSANPYRLSYDKVLFSAKAALEYKPSRDTLIYASISRGAKGGGFNNGFLAPSLSFNDVIYKDETIYAYELGEKISLFDRRLRINSSVFLYDYKDFQTFNYEFVGGVLTNEDARVYGAELEMTFQPTENFDFSINGAYLQSKIKNVSSPTPTGAYTADRDFAFAPKWTLNGQANYRVPFNDGKLLTFHADFNYRTRVFTDNFNNPGASLEAYFKANAAVTLKYNDQIELTGYVRNITDRKNTVYSGAAFSSVGILQARYAQPRTFGGSLTYHW